MTGVTERGFSRVHEIAKSLKFVSGNCLSKSDDFEVDRASGQDGKNGGYPNR